MKNKISFIDLKNRFPEVYNSKLKGRESFCIHVNFKKNIRQRDIITFNDFLFDLIYCQNDREALLNILEEHSILDVFVSFDNYEAFSVYRVKGSNEYSNNCYDFEIDFEMFTDILKDKVAA